MRNFNAILLPSGGEEDLYNTITPINTFRVIFDRYFGTNLGLVPDRATLALPREGNEDEEDDKGEHYNLLDVTGRARHDYWFYIKTGRAFFAHRYTLSCRG